uniref:Acrosin-binding protein n=1 Tax=Malurus cyaneus samueli TaxID=2593467 RepID=A0A8C5U2X4_9PASS
PIRSPHLAHSPLSDSEYQQFFARLHPPWQANMFCLLRQAYGCLSPTIVHLDQDENHGEIPEGPVCTELAEMVQFQTFCQFAQYRCLKEQFYVKVRSGMWGRVGSVSWEMEGIWQLIHSALSLDASLDTKSRGSPWNFTTPAPVRTPEQEMPPRGR